MKSSVPSMPALLACVSVMLAVVCVGAKAQRDIYCVYVPPTWNPNNIVITVGTEDLVGTSNGSGLYTVTDEGPSGIYRLKMTPKNISATSSITGFGDISTSLDDSRTPPESEVTSLTTVFPFPAYITMIFYARATRDDVVYTSDDPVILVADAANSFDPFQNEFFKLAKPVTFSTSSGEVGFTLKSLDVVF